jgi:hypothetical protein
MRYRSRVFPIDLLRRTATVGFVGASISIVACGSSSSDAKDGSSADCDALAKQGRDEVSRAIDAHKTCTTDADCMEVAFATSCFDSCSRGIAKSGKADVDTAKANAEKNACAPFKEKGCKVTIPPCSPPALKCQSGSCET